MRATSLPFGLLLLASCSDFNLQDLEKDKSIDGEGEDTAFDPGEEDLGACETTEFPPESVPLNDTCTFEIGGFEPVVAWEVEDKAACSLPAVGDIDSDGMPEVVVTWGYIFDTQGELAAYRGDGGGLLWETSGASLAYASGPTLADVDGDGQAEIYAVKMYQDNLFTNGDFSVVRYNSEGVLELESGRYTEGEFDHATGLVVADLDADGEAEVVAGRVILTKDLVERGVGDYGRGCDNYFGSFSPLYGEGTTPAVADMDLDGDQEVVVGNAFYDADARAIMRVGGGDDGAVAIANIDGDPEAEFFRATYSVLEAIDTNGDSLWTVNLPGEDGIMSAPAVGDVDGDGIVEVAVARGNRFWVYNGEDGTVLWTKNISDQTGATGASIFDFDADGIPEVVYIDEIKMYAFNGLDGTTKFETDDHSSDTLYDYPVIADVDANGHADIVVVHDGLGFGKGMSVFRDVNDTWAPARSVWNQHAYSITNINDDLTVPSSPTPNHTLYNNFHSALAIEPGAELAADLEAEVLATCSDDCDRGWFIVTARLRNTGSSAVDAGVPLTIYADIDGTLSPLETVTTPTATPSGMSSEAVIFAVQSSDIAGASRLVVQADDDGTGGGVVSECDETNNEAVAKKPFCGE